jgi:hypothetical protein
VNIATIISTTLPSDNMFCINYPLRFVLNSESISVSYYLIEELVLSFRKVLFLCII